VVSDALVSTVDHALSVEADEQAEKTKTEPQVDVVKCLLGNSLVEERTS
jgi:hypothetical protein